MGPGAGAGVTAGKARRHPGWSAAKRRGPSRNGRRCARCGGRGVSGTGVVVDHDPPYAYPRGLHMAHTHPSRRERAVRDPSPLCPAPRSLRACLMAGMARAGRAPEGPRRDAGELKGPRAARGEGVGSPNRADTVFIDPPSARKPRAGPSSSARPARTGDDACVEHIGQPQRHRRHGGSRSTLRPLRAPPPPRTPPRGASDVQERAGAPRRRRRRQHQEYFHLPLPPSRGIIGGGRPRLCFDCSRS